MVALIRLFILWRAAPLTGRQKEIHALVVGFAVEDACENQISGGNLNPKFLPGLSDHRRTDRLSPIEMTRGDAVVAIFITGVEAPQEQYLLPAENK